LYCTLKRFDNFGQKTQEIDKQELDRHASGPQKTQLVHTAKYGVFSAAFIQKSNQNPTPGVYRIAEKRVLDRAKNNRGAVQRTPKARCANQPENSTMARK